MPQGNSGPFTQCVLRCRTRKLSRTAIVTAKLKLRWWIAFRCGSLSAETYPRINLTDWCRSPRDVRFTACWFRRCRFKQRATTPPFTLPEDDTAGQLASKGFLRVVPVLPLLDTPLSIEGAWWLLKRSGR